MLKVTGYSFMKTTLECIPCFIKQALQALRAVCDDEVLTHRILQMVLKKAADFDISKTPPEMAQVIHRIIREQTNNSDPYEAVKKLSTDKALEAEAQVIERINKADDPFEAALRYAIAGNILDFAILSLWDDKKLSESLDLAEKKTLDKRAVKKLFSEIQSAEKILVLGDNAGETVFDKIFIEQFSIPGQHNIHYAVKSAPIINDAVYSDAVQAGLDKTCTIIENGTDAPGTVLDICSEKFRKVFKSADLIISKGQANFETLNTVKGNIFFLTQIKCPVIGNNYGYSTGEWVVWRSEDK